MITHPGQRNRDRRGRESLGRGRHGLDDPGLFGSPDLPPYAAAGRAQDLYHLPPSFVSVGGADGFRDESVDFALRLSQAGVATELHLYPGAPHGITATHQDQVNADLLAFIKA